jgi:hypothetical protein
LKLTAQEVTIEAPENPDHNAPRESAE